MSKSLLSQLCLQAVRTKNGGRFIHVEAFACPNGYFTVLALRMLRAACVVHFVLTAPERSGYNRYSLTTLAWSRVHTESREKAPVANENHSDKPPVCVLVCIASGIKNRYNHGFANQCQSSSVFVKCRTDPSINVACLLEHHYCKTVTPFPA